MMPFNPEKILLMFRDICYKHQGELLSAGLNWKIDEVYSPRFGEKVQVVLPLMLVDFKG